MTKNWYTLQIPQGPLEGQAELYLMFSYNMKSSFWTASRRS